MTGFLGPGSVVLEDLSKGDRAIEAGGFFTGEGIIGVVADQGLVVKSVNNCVKV